VRFRLNGEPRELELPDGLSEGVTVCALLDRVGLSGRRVAVAINACVVPRSRFEAVHVRDGDAVEVIHAVGGGSA
jgi:sulfur carrier protein